MNTEEKERFDALMEARKENLRLRAALRELVEAVGEPRKFREKSVRVRYALEAARSLLSDA